MKTKKRALRLSAILVALLAVAGASYYYFAAYYLPSTQQETYQLFPPPSDASFILSTEPGLPSSAPVPPAFKLYDNGSYYAMAEIRDQEASLMMSTFMWNLAGAQGGVVMKYANGYLHTIVNLSDVNTLSSIQVMGYPGLMYGRELWFPFETSTSQLPALSLPRVINDLPDFYSVLNYSTFDVTGEIDDFSYDIWLTDYPNVTNLGAHDVEIMIWMYSQSPNLSYPFIYVGKVTAPTIVNGSKLDCSYRVYVLPHTGSATGWAGVYFQLQYPNYEGVANGEVGVPIKVLLEDLTQLMPKAGLSFFDPSAYYLNAIQVGMESYHDPQGSAYLGYTLYSWKIVVTRSPVNAKLNEIKKSTAMDSKTGFLPRVSTSSLNWP